MSCPERRGDLAAYAVGALEPAERTVLQQHLADCAGCRDELADLTPVATMLGRLDYAQAARDPVEPGEALLERMLATASAERRTNRRRWVLGGVATGLAAVFVAIGLVVTGGSSAQLFRAHHKAVTGTVALVAKPTWTDVTLTLSGVPKHEHCWLVAVARDGQRDEMGSWQASYEGTARVHETTELRQSQLAAFVVETPHGAILTINV